MPLERSTRSLRVFGRLGFVVAFQFRCFGAPRDPRSYTAAKALHYILGLDDSLVYTVDTFHPRRYVLLAIASMCAVCGAPMICVYLRQSRAGDKCAAATC